MKDLFLSVNNITIRVYDKFFFENTSWEMHEGEQWLIVGPNGSGKSIFAKALAGILPLKRGEIICHFANESKYLYPSTNRDKIAYISFETQQKVITRDSFERDLASYIGKELPGKTVLEYVGSGFESSAYKETLQIDNLLHRELATLSTGEMRKVFILKTLLQNPKLLILDEPFDGLDIASKELLMKIINDIMKQTHVILIVHNPAEIPDCITHVMVMKDCSIEIVEERDEVVTSLKPEQVSNLLRNGSGSSDQLLNVSIPSMHQSQNHVGGIVPKTLGSLPSKRTNFCKVSPVANPTRYTSDILISMRNVTIRYGDKTILNNINWTVRKGENWVILGHNGAGKSTLMHLITGDQLQSYSNTIELFGQPKKSISMWDIKKHIGIVSTDIMLRFDKQISAYDVILSGLFDSIGLYRKASEEQKRQANEWIDRLHIQELATKEYHHLSFGQKHLILIARAVVKSPELLIIDEPCHGLDHENKKRVLDMLEQIGRSQTTHILLITHNKDEIISCITDILELENGKVIKNEKYNSARAIFHESPGGDLSSRPKAG